MGTVVVDPKDAVAIRWRVFRGVREASADHPAPSYSDPMTPGIDYVLQGDPAGLTPTFLFTPPYFGNSAGSDRPLATMAHVVAEITTLTDASTTTAPTHETLKLGLPVEILPLATDEIVQQIASLLKVQVPLKPVVPGVVTRALVVPRGSEDTEFVVKTATLQSRPDILVDGAIGLDALLTSLHGTAMQSATPGTLALHDVASSIAILSDPADRAAAALALLSEPIDRIAGVMALLSEPQDRVAATLAILSEPIDRVASAIALSSIPADKLADTVSLLAIPLDKVAMMIELVGTPVAAIADALDRLGYPAEKSAEAIALLVEPVAEAVNLLGPLVGKKPNLNVDASGILGAAAPVANVTKPIEFTADLLDVRDLRARIQRILGSNDMKAEIRRIMDTQDYQRRLAATLEDGDLQGRLAAVLDRRDFDQKLAPLQSPGTSRPGVDRVLADRAKLERLIQESNVQGVSRGAALPIKLNIKNPDFTKHLVRREDEDPAYKATNTKRYLPEVPTLADEMELFDTIPPGYSVLEVGPAKIPFAIRDATWKFYSTPRPSSPGLPEEPSLGESQVAFVGHTAERKLQRSILIAPPAKDAVHFLSVVLQIDLTEADPSKPAVPKLRRVELPRVPLRLLGLDLVEAIRSQLTLTAPATIAPGAPLRAAITSPILDERRLPDALPGGALPIGDGGLEAPFSIRDVVWSLEPQAPPGPRERGLHGSQPPLGPVRTRPSSSSSALRLDHGIAIPPDDTPCHLHVAFTLDVGESEPQPSTAPRSVPRVPSDSRTVTLSGVTIQIAGLDLLDAVRSQLALVAPARVPPGGTLSASIASPLISGRADRAGTMRGTLLLAGTPVPVPITLTRVAYSLHEEDGAPAAESGLLARWPATFEIGHEGNRGFVRSVHGDKRAYLTGAVTVARGGDDPPMFGFSDRRAALEAPPMDLKDGFTIELTIEPPDAVTKGADLFTQGHPDASPIRLLAQENAAGKPRWIALLRPENPALPTIMVDCPLEFRKQHVVASWSPASGNLRLYVDGRLAAQTPAPMALAASTEPTWICGFPGHPPADARQGGLGCESVSVYGRELTAAEVKARANQHAGALPLLAVPTEEVTRDLRARATLTVGGARSVLLDAAPVQLGPVPVRFEGFDVVKAALAGVKIQAPVEIPAGGSLVATLGMPRLATLEGARLCGTVDLPGGLGVPFELANFVWTLRWADTKEVVQTVRAAAGPAGITATFPLKPVASPKPVAVEVSFDLLVEGTGVVPSSRHTITLPPVTTAIRPFDWRKAFVDACRINLPAALAPGQTIRAELDCALMDGHRRGFLPVPAASDRTTARQASRGDARATGTLPLDDPGLPGIPFEIRRARWRIYKANGMLLVTDIVTSGIADLTADITPPAIAPNALYFVEVAFDLHFPGPERSGETSATRPAPARSGFEGETYRIRLPKAPTTVKGLDVGRVIAQSLRVRVPKVAQPGQPFLAVLESPYLGTAGQPASGVLPLSGAGAPGGVPFTLKKLTWEVRKPGMTEFAADTSPTSANWMQHLYAGKMPEQNERWVVRAKPEIEINDPPSTQTKRTLTLESDWLPTAELTVLGREAVLAKIREVASLAPPPGPLDPGTPYEAEITFKGTAARRVPEKQDELDLALDFEGTVVPARIKVDWQVSARPRVAPPTLSLAPELAAVLGPFLLAAQTEPMAMSVKAVSPSKRLMLFDPGIDVLGVRDQARTREIRASLEVVSPASDKTPSPPPTRIALPPLIVTCTVIRVPAMYTSLYHKQRKRMVLIPEFYRERFGIHRWSDLAAILEKAFADVNRTLPKLFEADELAHGAAPSAEQKRLVMAARRLAQLRSILDLALGKDGTTGAFGFLFWSKPKLDGPAGAFASLFEGYETEMPPDDHGDRIGIVLPDLDPSVELRLNLRERGPISFVTKPSNQEYAGAYLALFRWDGAKHKLVGRDSRTALGEFDPALVKGVQLRNFPKPMDVARIPGKAWDEGYETIPAQESNPKNP